MNIDILDGLDKLIDKDKLSVFNIDQASDIAYLSKGQDITETLSYYGVVEDKLNTEDAKFVRLVIARTKAIAKAEATKALFDTMENSKIATASTLAYLERFSPSWEKDMNTDNRTFSFNMIKSDE